MPRSKFAAWAVMLGFSVMPMFSTAAFAQDRDDHARQEEHRVYDSAHHDYHNWNADEDHRYREFMDEHHRTYRDFSRLSKKDQRAYWQWRHDHEDHR